MIASERETISGTRTQEMAMDPEIIERDKRAEKGRVRRLKVKVRKLVQRPRVDWPKLVGPEWVERLDHIKILQTDQEKQQQSTCTITTPTPPSTVNF